MAELTIRQGSNKYEVSYDTLYAAIVRFSEAMNTRSQVDAAGRSILVFDDESEGFKTWLSAHKLRGTGTPRNRKMNSMSLPEKSEIGVQIP